MTIRFRNETRCFRRHLYLAVLFASVLVAALRPSHVRAYRTIRDTPGFESCPACHVMSEISV